MPGQAQHWDLVVFLDADWDRRWTRNRQHFLVRELARQMQEQGQVLAVERPFCPVTGPFRARRKLLDRVRGRRGLRQDAGNLFVYTPFVLLHNVLAACVPGLTPVNRRFLRWQLDRLLDTLRFRRDSLVAWIHHPYQLEDIGLLNEGLLVYDCYDDYLTAATGWRLADLRQREAAVLARADLVLAASESLCSALQGRQRRVHLVANAVEAHQFAEGASTWTEPPTDIAALPPPVIGFVGKVAAWLDFELLATLAASRPEWSFAFVGPQAGHRRLLGHSAYARFRQASNVHLLGAKAHQLLPAYLKAFDVCIIPYLLEGQVPSSSPLKLYEYLACGRPIVSVDIRQVARLQPLVRIARDPTDFERAIALSLSEDGNGLRQRRLEAARENSWKRRAEDILQIIEAELSSKPA